MKSIFITIGYVLLFLIVFSLWGFYWGIRPIRITSSLTPDNYNVPYEMATFRTSDGISIKAWFVPSPKSHAKTIILLHGYPADKGNILPSRLFLHRSYNLLFMDFRYFGESGGYYSSAGKNEVLDLLAAIDYLKSRGMTEVGVWGFSMGGAVALMAAEKAPEIKAIVSESSYANLSLMLSEYYRIPFLNLPLAMFTKVWIWLFLHFDVGSVSPMDAIQNLKIPVLIAHSEGDQVVAFRHALLLKQALKDNKNAVFIFNKELPHGYAFDNYEKTIQAFFDKYLN